MEIKFSKIEIEETIQFGEAFIRDAQESIDVLRNVDNFKLDRVLMEYAYIIRIKDLIKATERLMSLGLSLGHTLSQKWCTKELEIYKELENPEKISLGLLIEDKEEKEPCEFHAFMKSLFEEKKKLHEKNMN